MKRDSKVLQSIRAKTRQNSTASSGDEMLLDRTKLPTKSLTLTDEQRSLLITRFEDNIAVIRAELNTVRNR